MDELLAQVYARSARLRRRRKALRIGAGSATFAVLAGVLALLQAGTSVLPPGSPPPAQARAPNVDRTPGTDPATVERPCSCATSNTPARSPRDPPREPVEGTNPAGYTIAFASDRDGDFDIYTMRSDGTRLRRLTDDPAAERKPQWSPDGKRVAFVRLDDVTRPYGSIYVMDADGSNERYLVTGGAPTWSPDGRRIAYHTLHVGPGETWSSIWVVGADGRNRREVASQAGDPTWTPDGRFILFGATYDGVVNVYAVAVDGSGARKISSDPVYACDPDVSPGGAHVAYTASIPTRIQISAIDGSSVRRITDGSAWEYAPEWSPDGTLVAFARDPDSDIAYPVGGGGDTFAPTRIVVARADGSGERTLQGGMYSDTEPSFKPGDP